MFIVILAPHMFAIQMQYHVDQTPCFFLLYVLIRDTCETFNVHIWSFAFFIYRIAYLVVETRVVPTNVEIEAPTIDNRKGTPVISLPLRLANLMFKELSLTSMRNFYNLHVFNTRFYNFYFSLHHVIIAHR
jgi:hypothetical protein